VAGSIRFLAPLGAKFGDQAVKKVLSLLLGVVVLLLVAALVGPSFVDWNEFRPEIAAEIKKRTGRDIVIEGDIDLAVLPAPTVSANGLRIANVEGAATPDMVTLKALRVRLAIGPLFEGTIEFENIALIEPVIELEVLPDGRRNWEPAAAAEPREAAPAQPGEAAQGGGGPTVRLERFRIENGSLTYRDTAAGTMERIEALNAEIAAETLAGPFRLEGDMTARGVPVAVESALGRVAAGKPLSITTTLTFTSADAGARFTGRLSTPTAEGELSGTLKADGKDLGRLVRALMQAGAAGRAAAPALLAQSFSLEGWITASAQALAVDDIAVQLGESRATGAVNVTLGDPLQADVALAANRIDLDRWLAVETPDAEEKAAEPAPSEAPRTLPPLEPEQAAFALPGNVAASLDLAVDVLTYRGGVVRQAKINAALDEGRITVNQASALLPGGSDVSLSGTLTAKEGEPLVEGTVEAVSDDLRGVFDWLKIDISSVPADRLRKFSFTSRIKGTPAQLDLSGMDLRLDASRFAGGVAIALRARPAFGLRLEVDRFNLDAYLPPPAKRL
jgi:uncharacterized protein involved in outer membrane biogenesis